MTNPGNIVRIRSRNGGRGSVYEANSWAQVYSQGLLAGNGVKQNTVPDMNVLVGGSPSNPDTLIATNPGGYRIALDIVGQQAVAVTAPASNSRIASIVAYSNDLSVPSTQPTTTGSPASCGLIVVYGSSAASPTQASDATIRTAITADGGTGSQAVYAVITDIKIESTTTSITNTLIDAGLKRAAIGTDTLANSAVTPSKLAIESTDANGWLVTSYGGKKRYTKTLTVPGDGAVGSLTPYPTGIVTNLPAGKNATNLHVVSLGYPSAGPYMAEIVEFTGTSFRVRARNQAATAQNLGAFNATVQLIDA